MIGQLSRRNHDNNHFSQATGAIFTSNLEVTLNLNTQQYYNQAKKKSCFLSLIYAFCFKNMILVPFRNFQRYCKWIPLSKVQEVWEDKDIYWTPYLKWGTCLVYNLYTLNDNKQDFCFLGRLPNKTTKMMLDVGTPWGIIIYCLQPNQ